MINFSLAREIYNQPWLMDSESFGSLFSMLTSFKSGVKFDKTSVKLNSSTFYDLKSISFVNDDYELRNADRDAELINVLDINGPITKGGGVSSYGTKELAKQMQIADKDPRVIGHMIKPDSGGGSSVAVQFMTDAIKEAKKPVITFIEKGSIAGSAMYGIISASDYIFSERKNNRVGSIGTYMEFAGYPKQANLENGAKYVRIYATKSTEKNIEFEEAINNNNFLPAIENILDPANNEFIDNVLENRPNATEKQLRGAMVNAGDSVGTLIDEIGSFQNAVDKILSMSIDMELNENNNSSNINLNNNSKMTSEELRSQHSSVYTEIFNDGVTNERDRSGAWLAHIEADPKAVAEGINGGEQLSQTKREEFFVKQNSIDALKTMKGGSAKNIVSPESKSGEPELTAEEKVSKSIEESFKPTKK